MVLASQSENALPGLVLLLVLAGLAGCASTSRVTGHPGAETKAAPPVSVKPHRPSHEALTAAANMVGTPYRYGGASPRGFDCSGLVYYAYSKAGLQAPRSTKEQYRQIKRIPISQLQPGDLIFFNISGNKVSHVGIYAGGNRFVHAPSSGKFVSYASLRNPYWSKRIVGAGRLPVINRKN
ncbi:NlpC/P60 family protein [Thiogranum longum]|uniref:NlpC/P60 family protein n=1 Tax=Thiogranum longum TaxID=1537524 RepID=A0A4R1HC70_9GAMM|nr:C40 family peptidase [Thiogranum longum]TCK19028.1 NlpC/P60 family protein [Thiogranum longum]